MAVQTHIDQIIDYTQNIIVSLANSKEIVGLMVDNPDPDIYGDDGELARSRMFDFFYVDETNLEAAAYILIESDIASLKTWTVKDMAISIKVLVNKTYMRLDNTKWKGVRGNRRDNILRQIDLLLNGRRDFGIGRLQLISCDTVKAPQAFAAKTLTYYMPDFARDRSVDE